jgi:hypothetical protein
MAVPSRQPGSEAISSTSHARTPSTAATDSRRSGRQRTSDPPPGGHRHLAEADPHGCPRRRLQGEARLSRYRSVGDPCRGRQRVTADQHTAADSRSDRRTASAPRTAASSSAAIASSPATGLAHTAGPAAAWWATTGACAASIAVVRTTCRPHAARPGRRHRCTAHSRQAAARAAVPAAPGCGAATSASPCTAAHPAAAPAALRARNRGRAAVPSGWSGPLQGPRLRPGSRPEPARGGNDGVLVRAVGGRGSFVSDNCPGPAARRARGCGRRSRPA